jgi:magnesium transporter
MEEIEDKKHIFAAYKVRLFWLVLGLVGSLFIAKFIRFFESTLEENLLIAAFIPLIVYMSDAVGTQMESIIIRAVSKEKHFNVKKFLSFQFSVVSLLAISLGILSGVGSYLIYKVGDFSAVLGLAVFITIISSLFTGLAIPYVFWRFHQDPAEASGPIANIIQNAISISIYFLIVSAVL